MQNHNFKLLVCSLVLSMSIIACNKSSDLSGDELSLIPTIDDSNLPTEEEYPSHLIATIQKDGHEITFYSAGSPDDPGIFMQESLYGTALYNQEEFHLEKDEGVNPFDVFAALTDTDVSIPEQIAKSAKDNLLELSGRQVLEIGKSFELIDPNYSNEETEVEYRGCSGDVGYSNFKNWYCKSSQSWNINLCGAGERSSPSGWNSIYNGQWQKHRNTRVRVNNTCNKVRVYFYNWSSSRNSWVVTKASPLTRPGNNYFSMWTSAMTYKRSTIQPVTGTRYRSLVNFVK